MKPSTPARTPGSFCCNTSTFSANNPPNHIINRFGGSSYPRFKSPIYKVFPSGARTFRIVFKFGTVLPFSILAMTGCFTPLSASSSLWESPLSFRALISSPIRATLRSLSAISSGVNNSFRTSAQVRPTELISLIPATPFLEISQFPFCLLDLSRRCFYVLFYST